MQAGYSVRRDVEVLEPLLRLTSKNGLRSEVLAELDPLAHEKNALIGVGERRSP